MPTTQKPTFEQEMQDRLKAMEARAKAVGSNMTQVCKAADIARQTYERWTARAPQSVRKLDELEAVVTRMEQEQAATAAQTPTE